LVAIREARLLKEKQLAELREAKRLEQVRIAQRLKEKQERAEVERQRLVVLQREKAQEAAERRELQREDAAAKDPFFYPKEQCRELGFKDKTEKFGACVLELSKRAAAQSTPPVDTTARSDGSPDDKTCIGYGYSVGTSGYADCRLKLDQARRDYERDLRAYEAERAEYDRRAAALKEENERQAAEALSQYGFCLASCRGDFLSCSSRCGSGSTGAARTIGEPPAVPSGFTTYILNGKIINCSRMGSIVTCN
jgi:actin-related protein